MRFQNACREGHTEIAFAATGTNLQLIFQPAAANGYANLSERECDFDKEHGKVRPHTKYNCLKKKYWQSYKKRPKQKQW